MPSTDRFTLHPEACLYAGGQPAASASPLRGFQWIAADAAAPARLCAAIRDGRGFCVAETAPSTPAETNAAHFLTLTGGSSGAPKLVRRSQASWIASFETNARLFDLVPDDSVAVFGALTHSLALYGVLEALHLGMDAHLLAGLAARQQQAQIAANGLSVLYLTPTQLRLFATGDTCESLPHVRLILCGGGDLDAATRRKAVLLCPNARIVVFYGSAETSFVSLSDAATPQGSVGRAYPEVEIEVRDPTGQVTAGIGEIWVRSPYLFDGYADTGADGAVWEGTFLSVGELGRLDEGGYLWIAGRKSRAVNIADQLFYPEAMESFLTGCDGVDAAAVLPVPDRMRGQRLVAVIEGEVPQDRATALRDACAREFGAMLRPRAILFREALPRLPSGKTDLAALTDWVRAQT